MPRQKRIVPDDQKHKQGQSSDEQLLDEEEESMPNPDVVEEKDTLDRAQDMGIYEKSDEENPEEVNITEEIEKDNP